MKKSNQQHEEEEQQQQLTNGSQEDSDVIFAPLDGRRILFRGNRGKGGGKTTVRQLALRAKDDSAFRDFKSRLEQFIRAIDTSSDITRWSGVDNGDMVSNFYVLPLTFYFS